MSLAHFWLFPAKAVPKNSQGLFPVDSVNTDTLWTVKEFHSMDVGQSVLHAREQSQLSLIYWYINNQYGSREKTKIFAFSSGKGRKVRRKGKRVKQ